MAAAPALGAIRGHPARAVFAAAYGLNINDWVHRVAAALGGATLVPAVRTTDDESASWP